MLTSFERQCTHKQRQIIQSVDENDLLAKKPFYPKNLKYSAFKVVYVKKKNEKPVTKTEQI